MIKHISYYINKYPSRMAGYLSAIILNISHMLPTFPIGLFIPVAMILIILGEGSQRMEDKKTLKALYADNDPNRPDEDVIKELVLDLYPKDKK